MGYRLRNLDIDANSWVAKNMNGGGMGGGGIKYELPYISWGRARWYGRESDVVKRKICIDWK